MNLDLGQLTQTFAIGALAVFGVFLLIPRQLRKLFTQEKGARDDKEPILPWHKNLSVLYPVMYSALIFATGVLLEDLSKGITSERGIGGLSQLIPESILPRDRTLRLRSLYDNEDANERNSSQRKFRPKPLFFRIFNSQLFRHFCDKGNYTQDTLLPFVTKEYDSTGTIICSPQLMASLDSEIIALYYQAHNKVYLNQTYFDELTRLDSRLDFARSLTFLSYILVLFALAHLIWHVILRFNHKGSLTKPIILLVLYIVTGALGRVTFEAEQDHYNARIFGYFESLCRVDSTKVQQIPHIEITTKPPVPNSNNTIK